MTASPALAAILDAQRAWARRTGRAIDGKGRTRELDDNLLQPLHAATRREYARGAGNELAGDLRSLRSSAALVCNVFDYWRERDAAPIAAACGLAPRDAAISFERTFPTGLRGAPPHLDVVLEADGARPMAIEAKFCEIFSDPHNAFRESYFESPWIWRELPNARALAREIADGRASFARLGAAQLLKHVLGLARRFGPTGFRLLYLWYEAPGGESRQHRRELDAFARGIARDFEFAELTYQQIFERLVPLEREHPAYIGYLRERYFPGAP